MDYKSWVAWWGAVLSTALFIIKLWEIYRDKLRIDVRYYSGQEDIITLFNPSKIGIQIKDYRLSWAKKGFVGISMIKEIVFEDHHYESITYINIPPCSKQDLTFDDEDNLPFGYRPDGAGLYIELDVVGRKRE